MALLSQTSKMPCPSFGISARHCQRGAQLRAVQGSACSTCYVFKGRYQYPNVQAAMEYRRVQMVSNPYWVQLMCSAIEQTDHKHFRWFDSGDLQSYQNLLDIVEIARLLPDVKFWLPTQEIGLIKRAIQENINVPSNLLIRVSAAMIDGPKPAGVRHTSGVTTDVTKVTCLAPAQGNKCLGCRACWDTNVRHVVYLKH